MKICAFLMASAMLATSVFAQTPPVGAPPGFVPYHEKGVRNGVGTLGPDGLQTPGERPPLSAMQGFGALAQSTDPRLLGAVYYTRVICSGAANDVAAALQADLNAFSQAGGGTYYIGKQACAVLTSDLVIPSNVALRGSENYVSGTVRDGNGNVTSNYSTSAPALFVNPAHTVRMSTLSSIAGITEVSTAYVAPTSYRTAIDNLATWTGTGITVTGANNTTVKDNFIIGFETAIAKSQSANVVIQNNRGDDINGITDDQTHDVSTTQGNEFFPYMTAGMPWAFQSVGILSVTNNGGGLWHVTLAAPLPTGVQTGDRVWLANPTPAAAAGRWLATVVDTTHVDLQGSIVAPASLGTITTGSMLVTGLPGTANLAVGQTVTGGGIPSSTTVTGINPYSNTITLSQAATASGATSLAFTNPATAAGGLLVIDAGWRSGTAYSVTNGEGVTLLNNFEYNWDTGYHIGSGAAYTHLLGNSVDAEYARFDPATVGFRIDGNALGTDITGGYNVDYGVPVLVDTTDPVQQSIVGMRIGATNRYSVFLNDGDLALLGVPISGGNPIWVGAQSTKLILAGSDLSTPIGYDQAQDASKVSGIPSGAWTTATVPVFSSAGTLTTATGSIRYLKEGRKVTFSLQVAMVTLGSGSGYIGVTMPFQVAATTSFAGREVLQGKALGASMPGGGSLMSINNYDNSFPWVTSGFLEISGVFESIN